MASLPLFEAGFITLEKLYLGFDIRSTQQYISRGIPPQISLVAASLLDAAMPISTQSCSSALTHLDFKASNRQLAAITEISASCWRSSI